MMNIDFCNGIKKKNDFDIFALIDELKSKKKVICSEKKSEYSKNIDKQDYWLLGTPTKVVGLRYANKYMINFDYNGVGIEISNGNIDTALILRNTFIQDQEKKDNIVDFFWESKDTKFEKIYNNLSNGYGHINICVKIAYGLNEEDALFLSEKISIPLNETIKQYIGETFFIGEKMDERMFEKVKEILEDIKINVFSGREEADLDFFYKKTLDN